MRTKVRGVGSVKWRMLNEGWMVQQQLIEMTAQYCRRFFANERPLGSCLPTLELKRLTRPYLPARSTRHLLAPSLFSFLSASTLVVYCRSSMSI